MSEILKRIWDKFTGTNINTSIRDEKYFNSKNIDTDVILGSATVRPGYSKYITLTTHYYWERFIEFRDEESGKDVLVIYYKSSTINLRRIYYYTKDIGTDASNYTLGGTLYYTEIVGETRTANVELDEVYFYLAGNRLLIGTGNGENNKALWFGYLDDTNIFAADGSSAGYYLLKQQFIQKETLFNAVTSVQYDSSESKYYFFTNRGFEIRDTDYYLEKVYNDVVSYASTWFGFASANYGGIILQGDYIFACGQIPGTHQTSSPKCKIVRYDISDDYKMDDYVNGTTTEEFHCIAADSNYVYVTIYNGTNGIVRRYDHDFDNPHDIWTNAEKNLLGIVSDGTYIYFVNTTDNQILKVRISDDNVMVAYSPPDVTYIKGITYLSGYVYFTSSDGLYSADIGLGFDPTLRKDYFNPIHSFVHYTNSSFYISNYQSSLITIINTSYIITRTIPEMIGISSPLHDTSNSNPVLRTYFYGVSVVDVDGQESCLCSGSAHSHLTNDDYESYFVVILYYFERDITRFRRIRSVKIYRAYSSDPQAAEPETNYNFLKEIDINESEWNNTEPYIYLVGGYDNVPEDEISTATFEEESGLPEKFKPEYVNWKYAIENKGLYYYANMYIKDKLYQQMIIQSQPNSPDINYWLDTNYVQFHAEDGDEIMGMNKVWNRLIIFKTHKCAIFNGIIKEQDYDLGLRSSDGHISINNNIYLIGQDGGLYILNLSGYNKISIPVEQITTARYDNSNLLSMAHLQSKNKIWFHFYTGYVLTYNYIYGIWNYYDLHHSGETHKYLRNILDGKIMTLTEEGDLFLQNDGDNDNNNAISISITTSAKSLTDEVTNYELNNLFAMIKSEINTVSIHIYTMNEYGMQDSGVLSFPHTSSLLKTIKKKIIEQYGEYSYIYLFGDLTGYFQLDTIILKGVKSGEINEQI